MTDLDPGRLVTVVRRLILREFTHDSCIASTLAVVEVARYFGVKARPQPTTIRAYTARAWQLGDDLAGKAPAAWPEGAYSVGIDGKAPSKPGRWNGHLVAVTATHLLDASLDQLARPQHGLTVRATAFEFPAHGWRDGALIGWENSRGTVIVYERTRDGDWRRSPNWNASLPTIRRVVGAAIRELREPVEAEVEP